MWWNFNKLQQQNQVSKAIISSDLRSAVNEQKTMYKML